MMFWLAAVGERIDPEITNRAAGLPEITWGQYVVAFCMLYAFCVGIYLWGKWLQALWRQTPEARPTCFHPRQLSDGLTVPLPPFLVASLWVGLTVVLAVLSTQTRSSPSLDFSLTELIGNVLGVPLVIATLLLLAWKFSGSGNRLQSYCPWSLWKQELAAGAEVFFLSMPGVLLFGIVSLLWRDPENIHVLLQLLQREMNPVLIVVIVLGAAVAAPLIEELLFRVVLQNGLMSNAKLPELASVWLVAVLFALAHGVFDAFQLMPLALLLGWSMAKRQSYLTVVAAHAMFNSFMLAMTMLQAV